MLFSCTSDDLENNSTNPVINQLKNDLKLDQFTNKNISQNLVVNWETLSRIEKDGFEIYEIEAIEKHKSKIESNLLQSELKYELISIKNKNEIHSYLVEVYSNLNYASFSNSIQNLKNFTGTLNVYELNGTLINQLVVFNGKSTNPSQNNHLTQLNEAINLFSSKNNLTRRVPECSTIFFVNIIVYLRTDHYSYITVGTYTQKALQYSSYSTYNRIEPMNVPCGGSEESYANHYITEFREVIDDESDPCKNISDQLNDTEFTLKIEQLNKVTNKDLETGYVQNKDGTFTSLNPVNGGHSLSLKGINYNGINGFIHTHLDDFPTGEMDPKSGQEKINEIYRMFSPADVIAFLSIVKSSTISNISNVYAGVITSTGDYTLRFTGNQNDIVNIKTADDYKKDYIKYLNEKGTEKGFLHFIKDHIKVAGIELYKLKKPLFSSNITIQSKKLNDKGKVETVDCE